MKKMRVLSDFDDVVEKKTSCEEWMGLTALLKRNWFSRRWVVQEITLARRATIHCGSTTIAWHDFAEAVTLFEVMVERVKEKFRKDPHHKQHPDIFGDVSKFSANRLVSVTSNIVDKGDDGQVIQKTWTLESLVSALTPFQAGRSHDIVYAVLSLAKDISGSSVSAPLDYTPSRDTLPKGMLDGKSEDEVKGFELDTVRKVEDTARSGVVPASWLDYANLAGVQYDPHETSTGTSTVKESFWRTMVAGKGLDGQNPPPYYAFVCEKTFTNVIENGGDVILGQLHDRSTNTLQRVFIRRVQSVVWGRRLTVTSKHKLLALVPHATKRGDLICILPGCSVPVVLRKLRTVVSADGEKKFYKFIGESYVHGMMAGEAFKKKNQTNTGYNDFYLQ
ncbi:hypothetical protein H2201_004351 [Coniosporium apollinis]|uniref:Heterokaryon incompatibility domain-containing protein n=1 Tax=Coniosporium apollinis TaxID=61459 RepID=A0ABQ9NST3_9PEZI|nr:hypothetical protein H2201_004351 [Coniosporium apollinis]